MSRIVTARNLHADPRCTTQRGTWNGAATLIDGKYRYEASTGVSGASLSAWSPLSNQYMAGKVLYARITAGQAVLDRLDIEKAATIVRRDGWIAARVSDGYSGNHTLWLMRGPIILEEVGVYTPADWDVLYRAYQSGEIAYPWVAGPKSTVAGDRGPWEI